MGRQAKTTERRDYTRDVLAKVLDNPSSDDQEPTPCTTVDISPPQLIEPLLLVCAETDKSFPLESRRRAEDILAEAKAIYHISVFSGVSHGFATRCNLEIENERWAKEEAARQIIGWFTRFKQ
ncbi:hypothetical protein H0H93_014564 [Arthromyces matolae]|nr:hypothetical protein H0H93_014564 [Arthromyces matolae]